jgi:quaternary ammonium compound-resistance protein SugE
MTFVYLVLAAFCFALGGLFMKYSAGASRAAPTVVFAALFIAGAILQAKAMRRADMGPVYIAVLGLEAVLALLLSVFVLHEQLSWPRFAAACLIIGGVLLLRRL